TMITLRLDRNLPRVEKIGNVTVHRIGFSVPGATVSDRALPWQCKLAKLLFPLTAWWKALFLHRGHRFDVVWAMMANQAGFAALFFNWMYPRVPFFLELQDGRPFAEMKQRRPALKLLWPLYRRIYMSADRIKCISYFLAEQVRLIGYDGIVEVIPNGVDVARFSAVVSQEKLAALREKVGKKPGDVFLFTASRLVLSRGVEDVIEALVHLPANVTFLIAGSGEDREKLEHIARGLQVRDRVLFAGHISHAELPAYLQISDIFVRPSIIEGFGNAFVEAMAAGIPIIGTPVGGIPDFLKEGETGLFCEVRNPRSIATAVQIYLDDLVLRSKIIEKARDVAREKYDWDLIAETMREKIFLAV
ncbi:MAG TPA: glycosyltransferase, partial [Candidatus Paceibacterota bacterium]|nr:glycosyltransferase [Candidatus Paceibacterota bacterium]